MSFKKVTLGVITGIVLIPGSFMFWGMMIATYPVHTMAVTLLLGMITIVALLSCKK